MFTKRRLAKTPAKIGTVLARARQDFVVTGVDRMRFLLRKARERARAARVSLVLSSTAESNRSHAQCASRTISPMTRWMPGIHPSCFDGQ